MPAPHVPYQPVFPAAPTGADRHLYSFRCTWWVHAWLNSHAKNFNVSVSQVVAWALEFEGLTARPESETAPAGLPLSHSLQIALPSWLSAKVLQIVASTGRSKGEVLRSSLNINLPQARIWSQIPERPATHAAPKLSARYNRARAKAEGADHQRAVHGTASHKALASRVVSLSLSPKALQAVDLMAQRRGMDRSGWIREAILQQVPFVDDVSMRASMAVKGDKRLPVRIGLSLQGLIDGKAAELGQPPATVVRAAVVRALAQE